MSDTPKTIAELIRAIRASDERFRKAAVEAIDFLFTDALCDQLAHNMNKRICPTCAARESVRKLLQP